MSPRRTPARTVLVATAVCLVAGCSSSNGKITLDRSTVTRPGSTVAPDGQALRWGSCGSFDIAVSDDVLTAARRAGMECATFTVPIDHAEPDGPTTELAVARIPASGDERIGSLFVNPGGPGGSGLEFLASAFSAIPQDWLDRFDIVSFDPRGIASSSPLDCLTQAQRAELVDEDEPDDPAEVLADALRQEQEVVAGCEADDDALFRHMGTDQVAADLDALRSAVGDEQLTFLGLSYGTRIAASYATQFPDRVRALVLDGSVTPSRDLAESQGGQIKGIVRALENFVAACNPDPTCAIAPDSMSRLTALADRLDTTPLTVTTDDGDERLDKDKFLTGVVTALYEPSMLMALGEAVVALEGTDPARANDGGRFFIDLAGQQDSRRPDGTYGNGFETQGVVNCLDADSPLEPTEVPRVREIAGPIPPLLDTDPRTDTPSCTALPTGDGLEVSAGPATPKLLLVGTEGDPATPIEWTRAMAEALGGPAVLTYGGSGHTASLTRPCVTTQVTKFLLSGEVPADLTDCARDPEEGDIYAQIANQFEAMGLGAETGDCIAEAIRGEIDPLGIVALNRDDVDPDLVTTLQRAAMSCR